MPTRPTPQQLNGNSAEILNAIRNDLGGDYAAQIPAAVVPGQTLPNGQKATTADSVASLRQIGTAMFTYTVHQNAFLDQLVNRIGRVLISSRLYSNPWSVFKKGYLEFGETVEDIFVNIAQAHQFDPETAESEVFKREIPDVVAAFYSLNYQKFYKTTVSEQQLRTAFLSWDGVTDLISKIIETMYTSANYDEWLMMKYLCAKAILTGQTAVQVIEQPSLENADQIMANMRELAQNVQYMGSDYNYAGVTTYTDPQYLYMILTSSFSANVDVGSLARAFNLEYVDFIGHTIGVNQFTFTPTEQQRLNNLINLDPDDPVFSADNITLLESVQALALDINWFMIFDNLEEMQQIQNPQGLYWNHFFHVWKTFATSPYANVIALTTQTPAVTAVTVTPSVVAKGTFTTSGGTMQLKADVTGTGLINSACTWSSSNPDIASVTQGGVVSVKAVSEAWATGTTVTITATSVQDPSKSGTCVITLA